MSSTEMKSYLSLIPISAKVRRRQNRMTILCIVIAVFLVTAVFSMADMAIRMETSNQLNKNGNWHIMVKDISPETAAELAAQEDVAAFSAYSDINASLTENYFAGDKRAALVGADDAILQIFPGMQCSTAPADGEVLVTANIRDWLDVTVGTAIPLTLPDGQTISLTVAGFNEDTSDANQYDAVVLVMNRSTFSQIAAQVEESFALGLVLNRKLYVLLITHYFGAAWQMPWGCLAVIVVVVLAAVVLAVYNPVRRILMQPITATISEL